MDHIMVTPGIKTVVECGVVCTVWTSWRHIFVSAFSEDARSLARLALNLEQRGYDTKVGFDGERRLHWLDAEMRLQLCAAE